MITKDFLWPGWDSNPRPSEPESDALFTKLPGLKCGDKSIKNPGIFLMIYLFLLQRLQNKNVILRATGS